MDIDDDRHPDALDMARYPSTSLCIGIGGGHAAVAHSCADSLASVWHPNTDAEYHMCRDQNALGGPDAIMGRRKGEGRSRNPGLLTHRPAQPNHREEDLQLLGQRIVSLMSHRLGQVQQ